jgi:GT2 family glycosyltransferase
LLIRDLSISVVIPTYQREQVLLDTIDYLLKLGEVPLEILVLDQTPTHKPEIAQILISLNCSGKIRWIQLPYPSIPRAMNIGMAQARSEVVLFIDDDIIPDNKLIEAHLEAHKKNNVGIVAGRVLQPWDNEHKEETKESEIAFSSKKRQWIKTIMATNFSIRREIAVDLGGFDENFRHVAYNFEAEFADRAIREGYKILFEPSATIRHLRVKSGGTRSFGDHLRTVKPSHAVGAYYYFFRSKLIHNKTIKILSRPIRAIRTKHHLFKPWWIPITLISELLGFFWALFLYLRGPRLIGWEKNK